MRTRYLPRKRPSDLAPARPDNFFLVDLAAVTPKELVPHLENPFFGLSKQPSRRNNALRRWENGRGEYLELQGDPRYGLPTVFDQDFVIYAASVIVAERRKLERLPASKGQARYDGTPRKDAENGVIRFSAADFAEFTHRAVRGAANGARYQQIEDGLNRITRVNISTNIEAAGYEATRVFGMVDESTIVRRRDLTLPRHDGALLGCEIVLSRWMMAAIDGNHVLPLHRDYFRVRRPLDRRIYQIVRKHCGDQASWEIGLPKLYAKSGSVNRLIQFRHQVKDFAARWEENRVREETDFLGYEVAFDAGRDMLTARRRKPLPEGVTEAALRLPSDPSADQVMSARELAPGYDSYQIYQDWLSWAILQDRPVKNPEAAFRGFVRRWMEGRPRVERFNI